MSGVSKKFYEEWNIACGDDDELATMLLNMFSGAIHQIASEIEIFASELNPLSLEEIEEYTSVRMHEIMGDFANEEQIDIILSNLGEDDARADA